jgi:hypothetical protein
MSGKTLNTAISSLLFAEIHSHYTIVFLEAENRKKIPADKAFRSAVA